MNTTAIDTDILADNIRMLENMLADIQAAGAGTHGEAEAQHIMAKIHKRVDALMKATDEAHEKMCGIGRVFGV